MDFAIALPVGFGVGGGFLIVPALIATRDMRMPTAVGDTGGGVTDR